MNDAAPASQGCAAQFSARGRGVEGRGILIDAEGRVVRARVLRSGRPLDEAALDAVRHWVFAPGDQARTPGGEAAQAPIAFRIY